MMKATFWILLIAVVCTTDVLGGKKKKPVWGPGKDLELCQELCKKFHNDCILKATSCVFLSEKGMKEKIDECFRKSKKCVRSCSKAYPKNA
ncbi:hypothetical protein LSAT2_001323 [Lamellibrachia satsuma]|nr:hypothetical protein LSAT2_001323 [Lamellibrachia satsuma]